MTTADSAGADVLFVCTGNQCRSPMAAAFLRTGVEGHDASLRVESAGLVSEGTPPPREVVDVMWAVGVDLAGHRSRLVTPQMIGAASLVVVMTKQQLVELTVMAPEGWERTFTFTELIHRASRVGGRHRSEPVSDWVRRIHAGRTRSGVLSLPLSDDIADPIGGRVKAYQRARDQLSGLAERLTDLLTPA